MIESPIHRSSRFVAVLAACAALCVPAFASAQDIDSLLDKLSREASMAPCGPASNTGERMPRHPSVCPSEGAAAASRDAANARDLARSTPECRRLGHCRPSRSFKRLHSMSSLDHERRRMTGKPGGPRYFGQKD